MHPLWYPSKSIRNACLSRGLFHSRKKHRAMFHFVENGIGETAKNFRCVLLYSTHSFTWKILTPCVVSVPLIFPPTSSETILSMRPEMRSNGSSRSPSAYKTPTELSLLSSARLLLEEFDEISRIMKDTKYFHNVPSLLSRNFCSHTIEYIEEYRCWEKNMVSA